MADKNVNKTKGSAYSQPDHIKPKSKWTKKTTVWVIVIAVIVLGILAIIGGENGWFKTKDMINGKIVLDDYSSLEISEADVNVDDASIQYYMDSVVSAMTTHETVTEGTVEDGDVINLDYSGVLEGQEEPFEGGTAEGSSLTIGSGTMIDGFESQIIGHEIGETFDIQVTFPEDYTSEDLAGQNATFTITVNSKDVAHVPELTDELAQEFSAANLSEEYDTVDALKQYYHDNLYDSRMQTAIWNAMDAKADVKYYNEADLATMTAYNQSALSYYTSSYGIDPATWASMYGYNSVADYAEGEAKSLLKQTMIADKIAEEQGIEITEEELDAELTEHMTEEGFTGTLEEFKAQSGDAYLFLINKTELLLPKVTEYLKGNVVLIPAPEEETEAAADDAAEDVSEAADEVVEDASEAADEIVEDASEAADEVVEDVSEAADEVVEDASAAADEVVEDVSEAAEGETEQN